MRPDKPPYTEYGVLVLCESNQKKRKIRRTARRRSTANRALYSKVDEAIAVCSEAETVADMVVAILVVLRKLGLLVMASVLEARDRQIHQGVGCQRCPRCGRAVRKPRRKTTSRRTLMGRLEWRRTVWQCDRCHKQFAPVDEAVGVVGLQSKHSMDFIRELVLECTLHPFERACELFARHWGLSVSTHLAYSLTMKVGQALDQWHRGEAERVWQLRETNPDEFEPVDRIDDDVAYVMLDDSMLRIQEGKRGRGAPKRSKAPQGIERYNLNHHGRVAVHHDDNTKPHEERGIGMRPEQSWYFGVETSLISARTAGEFCEGGWAPSWAADKIGSSWSTSSCTRRVSTRLATSLWLLMARRDCGVWLMTCWCLQTAER